MKRGISISLIISMLAVMLHLPVAPYYCGGKVTASKIYLSGKMASCGMESQQKNYPPAEPGDIYAKLIASCQYIKGEYRSLKNCKFDN